ALIRPGLCIVIVLVAEQVIGMSVTSANMQAIETALTLHDALSNNETCPTDLAGWRESKEAGVLVIDAGRYGTTYRTRLSCDDKKKTFSIMVRINQDVSFWIGRSEEGRLEVTYGDYGLPTHVSITDSTDLDALAKMR
ncbi:MAG: hypothetical protein AB8G16_15700, partial [Gammaproteobacteria bacterium]